MQQLALVIHVILAVGVIGLVLIQHGKGADAGAAFGSGASATVFGARGATSFLTRMTTIGAALFFATSLLLFYLAAHREGAVRSVTDTPGLLDETPAAPAPADGDLPGVIAPAPAPAIDEVVETPVETPVQVPVEPAEGQALPAVEPAATDVPDVPAEVAPDAADKAPAQ